MMTVLSSSGWDRSTTMSMPSLLDAYLAEREPSDRYVESLRRTVRKLAIYGIQSVCQLEPQRANDFLRSLDLSATTRGNIRRELLTLWRFAFEHAYTDVPPLRVMRIKQRRQPPQAWDLATIQRMLANAEADERRVSKLRPDILWSDIMPAWIVLGYDTALRFTDILLLKQRSFANGCVSVVAHKTGKATVRRLSHYSQERVACLLEKSPDGSLFRWCVTRRRMLLKWKSFLKEQGIPGSSRWLRRSAATLVERDRPGSAPLFLSHSNPSLARLHYVDETLLAVPDGPPALR